MAKDKTVELKREIIRLKRMHKRKLKRLAKYTKSIENKELNKLCNCGLKYKVNCYCYYDY